MNRSLARPRVFLLGVPAHENPAGVLLPAQADDGGDDNVERWLDYLAEQTRVTREAILLARGKSAWAALALRARGEAQGCRVVLHSPVLPRPRVRPPSVWRRPAWLVCKRQRAIEDSLRQAPRQCERVELWWGGRDPARLQRAANELQTRLGALWPVSVFPDWRRQPERDQRAAWVRALSG